MKTNANKSGRWSRAGILVCLLMAASVTAACNKWLDVTNPGAIELPALENPNYINLMEAGVIGDFQPTMIWVALWSGGFSDELRNHMTYFENPQIDLRQVDEANGTYALSVFNPLHRTRFIADSVASRLKNLLGDTATRDVRLARVLAMAGYAYELLGEQYCDIPINLSAPHTSQEIINTAIARFDEAITVGTAAYTYATTTGGKARADSIINLARVGAARASLWLNNKAKALTYAQAVTPVYVSETNKGFQFVTWHVDGPSSSEDRRYGSPFAEFIGNGRGAWFSLTGTPFDNLHDPRVPSPDSSISLYSGSGHVVRSPSAFSTYSGTPDGAPFNHTTQFRVASALEARYIIAEAQGLTADNVAFVNQRRAIGNEPALVNPTADEFMAALRNERSRDLFLDGHRMGDLRRYKTNYQLDLWPKGPYFGDPVLTYGNQECWPLTTAEKIANPNLH